MTSTDTQGTGFWAGVGPWLRDNGVLYFVAAGAYGGSLTHWLELARRNGQGGWSAWFLALCVDLLAFQAAQERQIDAAWRRGRKGLTSFPTVVLVFSVLLTLAGQIGTAKPTFGGVSIALIPGVVLLIAIAFIERRGAERARRARKDEEDRKRREAADRAARERQEAEQRARDHELEMERLRLEEADRKRRQALEDAERQRQERERDRQDRERRRMEVAAERHGGPSPSPGSSVTGTVMAPGLHVAPPPEARAKSPERVAMWAHWVHVIKTERRVPSGEDLRKAGGCNENSAAGRIAAREWRQIEPAASLLQEATGS